MHTCALNVVWCNTQQFIAALFCQFASMECIVTGFVDEFPKLLRWKTRFSALMCTVLFLLGLPCVTGVSCLTSYITDLQFRM